MVLVAMGSRVRAGTVLALWSKVESPQSLYPPHARHRDRHDFAELIAISHRPGHSDCVRCALHDISSRRDVGQTGELVLFVPSVLYCRILPIHGDAPMPRFETHGRNAGLRDLAAPAGGSMRHWPALSLLAPKGEDKSADDARTPGEQLWMRRRLGSSFDDLMPDAKAPSGCLLDADFDRTRLDRLRHLAVLDPIREATPAQVRPPRVVE